MLSLILLLFGIAAWVGIVAQTTSWIMRPFDQISKKSGGSKTFTTTDFFGLVLIIQIPLALVRLWYPGDFGPTFVLNSIGVGTAVAIWCVGVILLSRARVRGNWRRLLFTAVVLPFAIYGSLFFATVLVFGLGRILSPDLSFSFASFMWSSTAAVGTFAGLFACAKATRWIVAEPQVMESDVDDRDE